MNAPQRNKLPKKDRGDKKTKYMSLKKQVKAMSPEAREEFLKKAWAEKNKENER